MSASQLENDQGRGNYRNFLTLCSLVEDDSLSPTYPFSRFRIRLFLCQYITRCHLRKKLCLPRKKPILTASKILYCFWQAQTEPCSVKAEITCGWKDNLWLLDNLTFKINRNPALWKSVQMVVISVHQVFISSPSSSHFVRELIWKGKSVTISQTNKHCERKKAKLWKVN